MEEKKSILQGNRHLDTCRMFAGLSEDRLFNVAVMSLMSMSWILILLITEKIFSCLHIIETMKAFCICLYHGIT